MNYEAQGAPQHLYDLMLLLKESAEEVRVTVSLVRDLQALRNSRAKYVKLQQRIEECWSQYV